MPSQTLADKRKQVEFYAFASFGEPERALEKYSRENVRRGRNLREQLSFVGPLSPFLEIGANAGHSSYMLANEFGADGFALDISADALRYGAALMTHWNLKRAPVRLAGDATSLPFADNSLRLVCAFQMLGQVIDVERVFEEAHRVLEPGGVFFFSEEPIRRALTIGLWQCPYYETMNRWERMLHHLGLLEFLVRDVVGAGQEDVFGIRLSHRFGLPDWDALVTRHFGDKRYAVYPRCQGMIERAISALCRLRRPSSPQFLAVRLLGGTLTAFCKKDGKAPARSDEPFAAGFPRLLLCPDCRGSLRLAGETLCCESCDYDAPNVEGVYTLLPSAERRQLYPDPQPDLIDFRDPGHEAALGEGWYELEGIPGNRYRWMGKRASARLVRLDDGPHRLRMRGFTDRKVFRHGTPTVEAFVNGVSLHKWRLERPGMFVLELDVPDADRYDIELEAGPSWQSPPDQRVLTVSFGMLRLVPREPDHWAPPVGDTSS